jgi:hypothetical protein
MISQKKVRSIRKWVRKYPFSKIYATSENFSSGNGRLICVATRCMHRRYFLLRIWIALREYVSKLFEDPARLG